MRDYIGPEEFLPMEASNLVGVDPAFVDEPTNNFQLQRLSVAVDASVVLSRATSTSETTRDLFANIGEFDLGFPATDLNGNARPSTKIDKGAYEIVP